MPNSSGISFFTDPMNIHQMPIRGLRHALITGQISATELTTHFLERIERYQSLNCFISVTAESALEQAKTLDENRESYRDAPLAGIPIAHKDLFCTRGILTTCGSAILSNFVAPYDATMVKRLRQAGAIVLGKTNMDEFAMGSSNENSHYGLVHNPWDINRVPGGSSGGSAAAVAARLVAAATGTDTGGSIRQPAALCGLTGIKPTYGRVSRYGMVAFASSLDQAGVLAATAEDAAVLLQSMAGFDPLDSTSVDREVDDYTARLDAPWSGSGLRIGVVDEFFHRLDPAIGDRIHQALQVLQQQGAELIRVSLPNLKHTIPPYYVIATAEASSNLARYDGVHYGVRAADVTDLESMYKRTRTEGFGAEVKRRIMLGTYVLSAGYYDKYYRKAQQLRRLISDDIRRIFERVDVIAGPTSPFTAFAIGDKTDDPIAMYQCDVYTTAANLSGLPSLSTACGFVAGLPVGLQLIGNHFDEGRLLQLAHRYQQYTDWHQRSAVE